MKKRPSDSGEGLPGYSEEPIKLGELGEQEAQRWLDSFKQKMSSIADEVLSEVYVDCMPWIDTDSWSNFRNHVVSHVKGYKSLPGYDQKSIREAILKHNREEIIDQLNQDNLQRIKDLEEHVRWLQNLDR